MLMKRRSDALKGFPLFTMTQAKRLIGYFGDYVSGDWANQVLHTIAKNAYRLRDGRIRHRKRREIIYARTEAERRRWLPADKAMIVAALDRTEERVTRVINGGQSVRGSGQIDVAALLQRPEEDED